MAKKLRTPGPRDKEVVFGITPDPKPGEPATMLIGVPKDAWQDMRDGATKTIDLSKIGLPLRVVLYAGHDHLACVKVIDTHNKAVGVPYLDERHRDFSIEETPKEETPDASTSVDGANPPA